MRTWVKRGLSMMLTATMLESCATGLGNSVDNRTSFSDGNYVIETDRTYTPDKFGFSGGTGRVSISCPKVAVRGGQAYATIVFSSGSYSYVKANGRTYYGTNTASTSTFEIPVQLNQNNTIIGCTTKMSADHEITYSIFVYIEGAVSGSSSASSAVGELSSTELSKEAPQIAGLTFTEETVAENAKYYKIFHYEGGITCIEVDLGSDTAKKKAAQEWEEINTGDTQEDIGEKLDEGEMADVGKAAETDEVPDEVDEAEQVSVETETDNTGLYGKEIVRYLVVPSDAEIPAGLDKEMVVIRQPEQTEEQPDGAFRTYAASQNVLQWMDDMGQLKNLSMLGIEEDGIQNENVKKLLKEEKVRFSGTYDSMEYKALVSGRCNLAIMPSEIVPMENEGADEEKTLAKQYEKYMEAAGYFSELGIPMFVDRSSQEKSEKGQLEWIRVYGTIFGCLDAAEVLYQAKITAVK